MDLHLPPSLSLHLLELGLMDHRSISASTQDDPEDTHQRTYAGEWYSADEEIPF